MLIRRILIRLKNKNELKKQPMVIYTINSANSFNQYGQAISSPLFRTVRWTEDVN